MIKHVFIAAAGYQPAKLKRAIYHAFNTYRSGSCRDNGRAYSRPCRDDGRPRCRGNGWPLEIDRETTQGKVGISEALRK